MLRASERSSTVPLNARLSPRTDLFCRFAMTAVLGDLSVRLENPTVKWVAAGAAATGGLYLAVKYSWFRKNPFYVFSGKTGAMAKDLVDSGINSYNKFFDQEDGKGVGDRILSTPEFVNKFYSLITDFYEYGWGESFHFAAREVGESFEASIIRQETGETQLGFPTPCPLPSQAHSLSPVKILSH